MTNCLLRFLNEQDVEYKTGCSLSSISSIGIGGAATVVYPRCSEELIKLIDFLSINNIGYKIIGRMTNVLPCDEDYDGVIILTKMLSSVVFSRNLVKASSGISFAKLLLKASELGLGGAESLYGIPGTLGGMIYSNAGAFGKEISDLVVYVKVYDPCLRKTRVLFYDDLDFSYRKSVFKDSDLVILSATLKFDFMDADLIKAGFDHFLKLRKSNQPVGEPSLGSIFKRHPFAPISLLIDKSGLKGYRIGGAEISTKHAGFIVNKGNAKAEDVILLIKLIKDKLYADYDIIPEEEIEYLKRKDK